MRNAIISGIIGLLVVGCASAANEAERDADGRAGLEPALVVERFLQAANTIAQQARRDDQGIEHVESELAVMARLFGTKDGPAISLYPPDEVEQRMYALAAVLEHRDYALSGRRIVPGRTGEAVNIMVRMSLREGSVMVPFTVVRADADTWYVERIDIDPLLSAAGA